ncbi:TetR/AcrR family transcriptional regulator C-terminal domain-containing protein [Paenibacillus piscarius]|uniref:TetR/AcrR family transcriptional regulator C-terminal domain-containing protein n=1 Tax=Paenibacillus piscarius TaxID=1089681 RepID=UPI001EE7C046|nr:TetR/AcrR family transcriptional regulator C-terminal domain-containing protein [Paenibacillus piscarius]
MSTKDMTKTMFAEALIKLLNHVPFKKITVTMLANHCRVPRQTFYYHFHDKYELVHWIYSSDLNKAMVENANESWSKVTYLFFQKLNEKRVFYKKVLIDSGQNSLLEHSQTYPANLFLASLSQGGQSPVLKDLQFSLNYHAYACSNMTRHWLLSEPDVTPEEQNYRTLRAMPQVLYNELNSYREKKQV